MSKVKDKGTILVKGQAVPRRDFMVQAGSFVGLAGAYAISPRATAAADDPVIEFISSSCGEDNNQASKVLVGYASCCGSTGGIAEAIGNQLCQTGAQVDVKHITDVTDPSGYDAFVLGSAIQAGMWMPEGLKFIRKHRDILSGSKVAYFIACLAVSEDTPRSRKMAQGYAKKPLRKVPEIEPVGMGAFAGAVDYSKMPKKYRGVMKRIGAEDGDFRNWQAIAEWTDSIAPALLGK